MDSKKLRIPILRFLPDKPLAGDVFLRLALNKKSLRIVCAGESLGDSLLSRLRDGGHTHLEVSWDESLGDDSETYPIYLDGLPSSDHRNPLKFADSSPSEGSTFEVSEKAGSGFGGELDEEQRQASELRSSEAEANFGKKLSLQDEAENAVELRSEQSHPEEQFSPLAASEAGNERSARISGDENEIDAERLAAGEEEYDGTTKLSADSEEDDDAIQIRSGRKEKEARTIVKGGSAEEEVKVFKISSGSGEDEEESVIIRIGEKLETAKEMLLNGQAFSLAQNKDEILRDMKSSILVSKLAEKIAELRNNESSAEEVIHLAETMEAIEGGATPEPEMLSRFGVTKDLKKIESIFASDSPESEKVIALSEKIAEYARNREEVQSDMDSIEARKAMATPLRKENPNVVGKLASYLGYSLGYTNQAFLKDLSLGALIRISNTQLNESHEQPPFIRTIMNGANPTNLPESDGLEILTFLECYFKEPGLDLSQGDFSKKAFESTLNSLKDKNQLSPWNLMCWERFIGNGPTLESHSLCSRASAQALKVARASEAAPN